MKDGQRAGIGSGIGSRCSSNQPSASSPFGNALARKAATGDPKALSDLLERVRRRAVEHALARTQDSDGAEDIAQEVLIRVFKSIQTFRFQSRFSTWVFRLTENQIQSWFRSRASANRAEEKALLLEGEFRPFRHIEMSLDAERLRKTLKKAIKGLPELQDRTFRLVVLQELEPCEAARVLGKSQTNVRASLSRARVRVRKNLLEQAPALVGDLGSVRPLQAG